MLFIWLLILSYVIGAIPTGVWLGKILKNKDVRNYGSKNSGATNCYRVLGKKIGIAVLVGDVLKGFLPLLIASKYLPNKNLLIILGLVSILAHTYSVFIAFKGGKGVATSLGVFLYFIPKIIILLVAIFAMIVYFTKYISLGSVTVAILLPIFVFMMNDNFYLFLLSLIVSIFVIYRHKENILRLLNGTENKFSL